jgi:hypothetical protein
VVFGIAELFAVRFISILLEQLFTKVNAGFGGNAVG